MKKIMKRLSMALALVVGVGIVAGITQSFVEQKASATLDTLTQSRLNVAMNQQRLGATMARHLDQTDDVTFIASAVSGGTIVLSMTFFNASDPAAAMDALTASWFWTSAASDCDDFASAAAGGISLGTSGNFQTVITGISGWVLTNTSNGKASVKVKAGVANDRYACVLLPRGKIKSKFLDF